MLYFVLGLVTGIITTCVGVLRLVKGKLCHVQDADGIYFYMELNEPNVGKILKRRYVVLKVDSHK